MLGIPRTRLLLADSMTAAQADAFAGLISARAERVPLQHLIGTVAFGAIDIQVGRGVFIPRPETEQLVEWALAELDTSFPRGCAKPVVADFCSGTGAIALSVAHARPDAQVIAVEMEPSALTWLRRNAAATGSAIEIVPGDVTDPATLADRDGEVDMVLCNPPYVPDATAVPLEVRADPRVAVFGGADGLDVIRPVARRAATLLAPGGWLAFEHDESHAANVAAIIAATRRFETVTPREDLAGRPRFTLARHI